MESPKEEVKTEQSQLGWKQLAARVAIGIAVVLAIDYGATFIFHSAYPHDASTAALIPFQNHYLAQTDAFVTSEGIMSEFTDDAGAAARFLASCLSPFIGIMVFAGMLYLIPFTRKLVDYTWHAILFSFLLLMIDALFFPSVMTVFDRDSKTMIIHRSDWIFFGKKTEIPFDQIAGFSYEIFEANAYGHDDDVAYADLYANTANSKIFIGENQVGAHARTREYAAVPIERKQELDAAMRSLQSLIGK